MRSKKTLKERFILLQRKMAVALRFFLVCSVFFCPHFDVFADTDQITRQKISTPDTTKIYFYNPEINTAQNLVLKQAWDSYLHSVGQYDFQPVDNEAEFIRLAQNKFDAAFIMAEWFYSALRSSEPAPKEFEIAFQGTRKGKDTYKKVLIAHKGTIDFSHAVIACSGSKARAREILSSIYPDLSSQQLNALNILQVPKDIDALMAVGYGLAEMALSTELGLSRMSQLNGSLYNDMIVLRESNPLKRSVLVFKSDNLALKRNLASLIIDMGQVPSGQKAMYLLGLDNWEAVPHTIKGSIPQQGGLK